MPREPIRVELILCDYCGHVWVPDDDPDGPCCEAPRVHDHTTETATGTLVSTSYAARQIELAVAVLLLLERWGNANEAEFKDADIAYDAALKAVREHPDHKPNSTGGS